MYASTHTTTQQAHPAQSTHELHTALHHAPTSHPHRIQETHRTTPHHAETGSAAPTEHDPLKARYEIDANLPKELREEARDMDWSLFIATYAPEPTLKVTYTGAEKKTWMLSEYSFEVHALPKTAAPRHTTETAASSGPVRAISRVLDRHNRYVEILAFHQIDIFQATATCIKVGHSERYSRTAWVIGFGPSPEHSAAAAMSAGAQRIHGNL